MGVAVVASSHRHACDILDEVERLVLRVNGTVADAPIMPFPNVVGIDLGPVALTALELSRELLAHGYITSLGGQRRDLRSGGRIE